jgi:hypothetical protein
VTDAVTVVGDLDEFEAAVFDGKVYGSGRGVQTVLDELLYGGYRRWMTSPPHSLIFCFNL